ncbi:MAG: aminotransferase class III-fold pyridoxal phosphate-dependent enzyme, partial [Anaerovoracaceae bacterium]
NAYVKKLETLAAEHDILLIFDEVQTGNCRTGDFFSYQGFGVLPDLVTTAKGLGGGLPIGALLVNEKCRSILSSGTHGSTFGGNPIACAGANAVLDIIEADGFSEQVKRKGEKIRQTIVGWELPIIKEVRGKGLMLGIEITDMSVKEIVADLLTKGLVLLTAGSNVLRLLPPLTITDREIDRGLQILYEHLVEL